MRRRAEWHRPRPRHADRDDAGFTLVEVIVAFLVLLIVLVPVASLLGNVIGQAASARERLTALSLAEQYLEKLNNTPFGAATVNRTSTITTLPTTNVRILQKAHTKRSTILYTVYAKFSWATGQGASDLCTSGLSPQLLDLQIFVDWGSNHEITDSTLIDYPPVGLETYGFLAVQVNGDPASGPPPDAKGHTWATRVTAVPITISSLPTGTSQVTPFSKTVYPNKHGCVFEEVPVPPGSYSVTVDGPTPGTPSGTSFGSPSTPAWAANFNEGSQQTQKPFTVTVGRVTLATFTFDEGSLVDLRYPTTTAVEGGVTCPGSGSIVCVVTGQAPSTATTPSATPVGELSVLTPSGWKVDDVPSLARVTAVACAAGTRCIGVGYARSGTAFVGASVSSQTASPSFSSDAVPSTVTALDGLTCPSSTRCYAYGQGATGAVILSGVVSSSGVAWVADGGLGGVTAVSDLVCPGAASCYAVGTTGSGPTILSLGAATSWALDGLPTTPAITGLTQLACPGTVTCYAVGSSTSGPVMLSLGLGNGWAADTLPGTPTLLSLSRITCPSTTTCFVVGTAKSGSTVSAVILSVLTATTWIVDPIPSTVRSLEQPVCPSDTHCYVVGRASSGPAALSSSGTSWVSDGLPPGLDTLTGLACATSRHCFAAGTATSTGTELATIVSFGSATSWTTDALPAGSTPVFLSGVACAGTTCVATGAAETGAVYLDGTSTGSTWSLGRPNGVGGMYAAHVPISVSNSSLEPTGTIELGTPATPTSDLSRIGPLFPFVSGYSVAAAECKSEMAHASSVATTPGATASVDLAMGLLPIEVLAPDGAPVAGATVSAAIVTQAATPSGTCTPLTPLSGTNTAFSLERTGPDGLSELAVIYDRYRVTATTPSGHVGSAVVTVGPGATTVGATSLPLPQAVEVTVT